MLTLELLTMLRRWRARPQFVLGVVAALGVSLAVALATTVAADALLVRRPVGDAPVDRLVDVEIRDYPSYLDLRRHASSLDAVGAWFAPTRARVVQAGAESRDARLMVMSADVFTLLGAKPRIGRFFGANDDQPAGQHVAVVSEGLWRSLFGGSASAIGATIAVAGDRYTIVGIAPDGFAGPELARIDVFLPITIARIGLGPDALTNRSTAWLRVLGRLRPGASISQAQREIAQIVADAPKSDGDAKRGAVQTLMHFRRERAGESSRVTTALFAVGLLILAIGCIGAAGLLVGQEEWRREEIQVRLALGAPIWSVAASIALETLALCVLSVGVAIALSKLIVGALAEHRLLDVATLSRGIDGRADGIVTVFAALAIIAVASWPLLRFRRLVSSSRRLGASRTVAPRMRSRKIVLTAQLGLTLPLVVSAALFAGSLRNALRLDLGMRLDGLVTTSVELGSTYPLADARQRLEPLMTQLSAIRGVRSVAASDAGLGLGWITYPATAADAPAARAGDAVGFSAVTPAFFETIGMRLVSGRTLQPADERERVAVVTEEFAKRHWGRSNALGRCVVLGRSGDPCAVIVGIVGDRKTGPGDPTTLAEVFVPMGSPAEPSKLAPVFPLAMIALRTERGNAQIAATAQRLVMQAFPNAALVHTQPAVQGYEALLRPWRLGTTVFGSFAIAAVLVAVIGLYASLATAIADSRRELAIRIALGAGPGEAVKQVAAQVLWPIAAGTAVGVMASAVLARGVRSVLFGLSPLSPASFGVGLITIVGIVAIAMIPTARRVTRLDPADVLRSA